jgi:hypothetical protein
MPIVVFRNSANAPNKRKRDRNLSFLNFHSGVFEGKTRKAYGKKSHVQYGKTNRNTLEAQAAFIYREAKGNPMAEKVLDQLVGTQTYKPTH